MNCKTLLLACTMLLAPLASAVAADAAPPPASEVASVTERTYDLPKARVFDASISAMKRNGQSVNANADTGLVSTYTMSGMFNNTRTMEVHVSALAENKSRVRIDHAKFSAVHSTPKPDTDPKADAAFFAALDAELKQ